MSILSNLFLCNPLARIMHEWIYYAAPFLAVLVLRRSTYPGMRPRGSFLRATRPDNHFAAPYEKLMHNPG